MSDTIWAVLVLVFAAAGMVGFVYYDVAENRRQDEDFRREVEELRKMYERD